MPDTKNEPTLLEKLSGRRDKLFDKYSAFVDAREAERSAFEERKPEEVTDEDRAAYSAAEVEFQTESERRYAEIVALDERIDTQKDIADRRAKAAKAARKLAAGDGVITSEPLTYRKDNSLNVSYFADLAVAHLPQAQSHMVHYNHKGSQERLQRHAREMEIEMPKREAARARESRKAIEENIESRLRAGMGDPFQRNPFGVEQRVTPNRTDGQGGYFIPPMWWDDFIRGLRPGRVTANLFKNFDMPAGTDVIVVPKLSTLTTVATQGADNQPVSNTDWTDTAVTAQVKTLSGFSDIGVQLLDQSPYPVDQMVLADLLADYDKKFDLQLLTGSASTSTSYTPSPGGQTSGLYSSAGASPWSNANTVTYTDGSPAPWKLFSVLGACASQIATNRFQLDDSFAVVVHPRRAWWLAAGTDSQNRPLVESRNFGPFNVAAVEADSVPAQGLVMQLPWGPRVYASANVPTTDTAGGGTGQDVAIAAQFSDCWAFEGQMHTDVFSEVLSANLSIRFRVYAYVADLVRYGQSLAIASGSGFAAPTGAVSSITY